MMLCIVSQAIECYDEFEIFKNQFKKQYTQKQVEEMRDNFCLNWMYLNYLIKHQKCDECGITSIMDRQMSYQVNPKLGQAESQKIKSKDIDKLDCQHKLCAIQISFTDDITFYNQFDLRDAGTVTKVKDQGNQCGSCWAYSLSAVLESLILRDQQYGLATDKPFWTFNENNLSLSEQFIMSNSNGFQQYCDKGNFVTAVDEIVNKFQTIELQSNIPNNMARYFHSWIEGIPLEPKISKSNYYIPFEIYQQGDVKIAAIRLYDQNKPLKMNSREMNRIKAFISRGIAVSGLIYAAPQLTFYQADNIIDIKCPGRKYLNHQITFIGYGKKTKKDGKQLDVWVIRNSWSDQWGSEGMFFVIQGKNSLCSEMYFYSLMPKYLYNFEEPIKAKYKHNGKNYLDDIEIHLVNQTSMKKYASTNTEQSQLLAIFIKLSTSIIILIITIIIFWLKCRQQPCIDVCDQQNILQ